MSPVTAGTGQTERAALHEQPSPVTAVPTVVRLLLRRSVGRPAILAATAVIIANVMLRDREWVHLWDWAWFNYHFVTIFLGPLAAGLGAWEGARLARAHDFLDSAGAARRALVSAGGAVFAWLLLPYLAGLAWVSVMVMRTDAPGGPGIIEFSTLGPALAFLAAWVMVGAAAGYRLRSPLSAPLAAVVSFAVILTLYIVNYMLVRVGGATGSTLGLAPRPEIQLGQLMLYVNTAVWALTSATRPAKAPLRDPGRLLPLSAGTLVIAVGLAIFFDSGPDFRDRPVALRCFGQEPQICLVPGYDGHPERVRAAFEPLLAGLREIGAPLPTTMRMGDPSEEDLVGLISEEVALGEKGSRVTSNLISAYKRFSCDYFDTEDQRQTWHDVYFWFETLEGTRSLKDSIFASEVLRTSSREEQAAYLRGAIDRLRRCA